MCVTWSIGQPWRMTDHEGRAVGISLPPPVDIPVTGLSLAFHVGTEQTVYSIAEVVRGGSRRWSRRTGYGVCGLSRLQLASWGTPRALQALVGEMSEALAPPF